MPTTIFSLPLIDIQYINKRFIYKSSSEKNINPMIDVISALKKCFVSEVNIGCHFILFGRRKNNSRQNRLKPSNEFYKKASEQFIIKKSLNVIAQASLKDNNIVQLCLALTRHPFYQNLERSYQTRKNNPHRGYLSNQMTAQQVAKRFYKSFKFLYPDLYVESIEQQKLNILHSRRLSYYSIR